MKTKINEKGVYPKVCVDCEVQLNPGKKRVIYQCLISRWIQM
jgi:predicted RNA-binding Zn-ribbon protein involved in translation (DUF1610 family)